MKHFALKLISLLLVTAVLAGMAACGGGVDSCSPESVTAAADTAADTTEAVTEPELSDNLPDRDWNGKTITFAIAPSNIDDIWVAGESGDVCNDAVYQRNILIEDRFNVKIATIMPTENIENWYDPMIKVVMAGEDVFQVAGHYAFQVHKAISQGIYQDWMNCEYINLDQPWWFRDINDSAVINGKLYNLTGNLGMSLLQYTAAFYYNIKLAESYGHVPADFYKLVRDGSWTFDTMTEMVKPMYSDLNGDGARDDFDQYGWATHSGTVIDLWQAAFDLPMTARDKDGNISVIYMSDKRQQALEKVVNLYAANEGAYFYTKKAVQTSWLWYEQFAFSLGQQTFCAGPFLAAYMIFRDMEDAYGILPLPKWDEKQAEYYTNLNDRYTVWGIPMTTTDYEFIGMMVEAMACESYKSIYPAYFDVALKSKYSEDADTAEMVDIVVNGMQFDFAYTFGTSTSIFANMPYLFRERVRALSTDLSSAFAAVEEKIEANLDTLMAMYE